MKAISLAVICVMLAAAKQAAQSPQNAPATGIVKFQANTQLVIETVSVKDKSGKPVEGLTTKAFTVTEDGGAQTISSCEFQNLDEALPRDNPAPDPTVAPAAAPASPAIEVPGV